jgi:3-deoxy-D-manno-octulosonic acid kinase
MNEAAAAGEEALARGAGGAMLYDASCLHHPDAAVFEPGYWQAQGALESARGGRGTVAFVRTAANHRWVLRHYRRGGLMARLVDDQYLWTGADRTRSFREWRLLRQLRHWGLPVPQPVAARYRRAGLFYRADLITAELPVRLTVAQALQSGPLTAEAWRAVGACVGALHARGVQHADLNAHNLLLGEGNAVYVLDFDRGCIRERDTWEQAVLDRLQRSLRKVTTGLPADRFGEAQWQALLDGVQQGH